MAKSQESFNKKEKEKKRLKKRKDKEARAEERKTNSSGGDFDSMIAYVDEYGNITDTPPDPTRKSKVNASSIEVSTPKKEAADVITLRTGKIDYFNDAKGFGFIKETNTQEKYFVHINGLLQEVKEGDKVSFELERGNRGMNAVRVKKI